MLRNGAAERMFPELLLAEDLKLRREILTATNRRSIRSLRFWLMLVPVGAIVVVGVLGLQMLLGTFVGPLPPGVRGGIFGGIAGGSAVWLLGFVLRSRTKGIMREELRKRGIPVCLHCGYSLRGVPEPRCPECGKPADAE